jgi:hypothetical protein
MINNIIEIKCTKCNNLTKIKVNTISNLENRITFLEDEVKRLNEENSSLRMIYKMSKGNYDGIFDMFKDKDY